MEVPKAVVSGRSAAPSGLGPELDLITALLLSSATSHVRILEIRG